MEVNTLRYFFLGSRFFKHLQIPLDGIHDHVKERLTHQSFLLADQAIHCVALCSGSLKTCTTGFSNRMLPNMSPRHQLANSYQDQLFSCWFWQGQPSVC